MKKKHFNAVFLFCIITISLFIAGCGGKPAVVKETEAKPLSGKKGEEKIKFTKSDVAPQMKIFGTGNNFYGVVTSNEAWKSGGEPPHWLVLDGMGEFEGISFRGLFNISQINIYIKNGDEYVDKIMLTNINLTNGSIETKLLSSGLGSLVKATRFKIEFDGTNISVSNIGVYGVMSDKKENKIVKEYKMDKKEEELISASGVNFGQKKFKKAIIENEAVIRMNPENPYAYMNLGQIYQAMGEGSEEHGDYLNMMRTSIEKYEAADREDNPERLVLVERLAKIYQNNLLNSEKAEEKWKEYIELMKASGEANGNKIASALVSGINFTKAGYDPGFETVMDEVIKLVEKGEVKKNNFDVYLRIIWYEGYLIVDRKDYEKAIRVAKLAIEKFPNIENIEVSHQELALACMALGRWEEAIEAWKGYVNIRRGWDTGIIHNMISYCYLKIDDKENSYKHYIFSIHRDLFKNNSEYRKKSIDLVKGKIREGKLKSGLNDIDLISEIYKEIEIDLKNRGLVKDNYERDVIKITEEYLKKYNVVVNP